MCLLISWLNGVKAQTGRDRHTDQRLDEWQRAKPVQMVEGWLTESCFWVVGMESRKEGKDGWSDGNSSGPVFKRQLSKAQLSQQNSVCVCGVPPPEPHASSQMCVVCDSVCPRERERGVVSTPSVRCRCSPPSALSSCLLSCCELNALQRCCSLCLPHPFTLPFSSRSLTRSLGTLTGCLPLPPRLLLSAVIILRHHRLRVRVVLPQPCSAACRVQPLKGVSCERP